MEVQEYFVVVTPPPPPPPSTTIPNPTAGVCALVIDTTGTVITSTANITNTPTISGTTVVTQTANFIRNPSFETPKFVSDPWVGPYDWAAWGTYTLNSYQYNNPAGAFDGSAFILSETLPAGAWDQYLAIEDAPGWLLGLAYQWEDGVVLTGTIEQTIGNPGLRLYNNAHNSQLVTLPGETDWVVVEHVFQPPPFAIDEQRYFSLRVQLPDTQSPANSPLSIDDLYLVPVNVDEEGNPTGIYCGAVAANYTRNEPPPTPPTSTLPIGTGGGNIQEFYNLPLPVSTAGTTCYTCQFPYRQGAEAAIAWLGCILRNLFACDLRLWLFATTNAVLGVIYGMNSLAYYWQAQAAAAIVWGHGLVQTPTTIGITAYNQFAGYLATVPTSFTILLQNTESGIDWFSLLLQLIMQVVQLIGQFVAALFDMITTLLSAWLWLIGNLLDLLVRLILLMAEAMAVIIQIVWGIFTALFGVWEVEPLTFNEFVTISNGGVAPDLSPDQANQQAGMMLYFVWGLAAIDAAIWDYYLIWIPFIGAGLVAWKVLTWFIEQWREILPYMG